MPRGWSHVGLSTLDLDATRAFYEDVLGFECVGDGGLDDARPSRPPGGRAALIARGVKVTPVVDHEWMKSIYFKDPNGLMLEFAWWCRELGEDDAVMQVRERVSLRGRSPVTDFRDK